MFVYRVSKIRCLQRLSMLFLWDFYRDIMNYYDIPSWKPRWTSKKLEDDWPWVVLYVFGFYNDRVLVLYALLFNLFFFPLFFGAESHHFHKHHQVQRTRSFYVSSPTCETPLGGVDPPQPFLGLAVTAATSQKRYRRFCPLVPFGNLTWLFKMVLL